MKTSVSVFIVGASMVINALFMPQKDYHQEITRVVFSICSIFFAIFIANTYSFDTTNYSENFEKKLDNALAGLRKKAILFYTFTVVLFLFIDIVKLYGYAPPVMLRLFSSAGFSAGFSFVHSIFLVVGEMQLYCLRNDIKHRLRKEQYNEDCVLKNKLCGDDIVPRVKMRGNFENYIVD